jgi:hypothetical protein
MCIECPCHLCLLLQASSDFFGDQMKSAANQRAKAIAAAEDAGADDAIDADASADAENGETHRLWYLRNQMTMMGQCCPAHAPPGGQLL